MHDPVSFTLRHTFTQGTFGTLTLPAGSGGTPPLRYDLDSVIGSTITPIATAFPGLTFNAETRVLSGIPTTIVAEGTNRYHLIDATDTTEFANPLFIVTAAPDLTVPPLVDHSFLKDAPITAIVLPQATGGFQTYTYALSALPAGLNFDAGTRTISGTPTADAGDTTMTYTATDMDPDGAESETSMFNIAIVVTGPPTATADSMPTSPAEGTVVTLVGVGTDPDVDDQPGITYRWTQTSPTSGFGSTIRLSSTTDASPTFTVPELAENTNLVFSLVVTAGGEDSLLAATHTVSAVGMNDAPTVSITHSPTARVNSIIPLTATIVDADGAMADPTFAWTVGHMLPDGASLTGTPATTVDAIANPTFDTAGYPLATILTFGLTVTSDSVAVSATAVAITLTGGADQEQVTAIVSEVARAMVSSTVSAVTNRIGNVASGGGGINAAGLNWNNSNMASALTANAQALSTNSDAMKILAGDSTFSMPLNAVGDGSGGINSLAVWASGEYSDLSGKSAVVDWEGELSGFHLGVDGKIQTGNGNNILIGVALSSLNSDLDYKENDAAAEGAYEIGMTTISPYIGWRAGVVDLWASVGVGDGEIERNPDGDEKTSNDATQISYAIGGGADLVSAGDASLRINGEVMQSIMDLDGDRDDADDDGQTLNSNRVRISMEMSLLHNLLRGGVFKPSVEVGLRYDGGDGETGTGMELGGKLQYYSANGFTAEGSARVLLAHSGEYDEWGIQGTVRKQVGRDGQGLSFHLTPAYGDVNSGVQQLLAQGLRGSDNAADDATDSDYQIHLTTRLGYGIAMRNAHGMLTPYTEMVLGTTDQYRMGINWKPNQAFNLTLLSEQAEQNMVRLQGAINF